MEDNPRPRTSSQVEDTLRHTAASESPVAVVSTSKTHAGQKRKIANLEGRENLESVKRETNSQGRAIMRRVNNLLDNVEELMSENDCNNLKDDNHNLDVTLILGQDRLRIGYVTLKKASDNNNIQHDDYLHMSKKPRQLQGVDGAREDVNDDRTTQLMAQAQQLRDSQNRIDTLHTQLFDLRSRLYEVEHAHNMAEIQRPEMLQTQRRGLRDHHHTQKLHSPPPKRKSMVHEYHLDGGQSIRWLTDEEFEPYDEQSANEDSPPVVKAIGGPLSCGLAARQHMSLSRRWALRRFQKARDPADLNDEPDTSAMHHQMLDDPDAVANGDGGED
ncbi:hypothetical protein EV702DRAFT_373508 [Suillus placidus]|uniref:Uncharacterized protein n=1 Tax=Suillus placidus TaxID=48579 RepID=A0A9P7D7W1_9AGAM|nr:hypothetical protein EV702DRAFT_373508 [Suillus placidus]